MEVAPPPIPMLHWVPDARRERRETSGFPCMVITSVCGHFFPWPPKSCCHVPAPSRPFMLVGMCCRSLISRKLPLNPQTRITHHQGQGTVRGQSPEGPCYTWLTAPSALSPPTQCHPQLKMPRQRPWPCTLSLSIPGD